MFSPNSAAESVQEGILMDPCSPKGYSYVGEPADVPNLELEREPIAQAGGNFSACRSAASVLLQKEKGSMDALNYRLLFGFN